jgi:hypothetical protein
VAELKSRGVWIDHLRRSRRTGYKAGALREGMARAKGRFLAVFDADFVPPPDFLLQAVPFFLRDPGLGLVQGRWTHLNASSNFITRLQSVGINGHFAVEQSARSWNNLFMNFNGTAGIFRKSALIDAGNWQDDTLTEDLDVSYRMQMAGWRCRYLFDLEVPAEIPENLAAFKNQQFRWAKGSIQTAIKLLPRILRFPCTRFKKIQAVLHVTHYAVNPLILYLSIMALPLLAFGRWQVHPLVFSAAGALLLIGCSGPSRLYWTAETALEGGRRSRRLWLLPVLICFGCGMAVNNTKAVFEALAGRRSEFVRTPKSGTAERKRYRASNALPLYLLEILLGAWCAAGLYFYATAGQYLIGPFLFAYASGFGYAGVRSLVEHHPGWFGQLARLGRPIRTARRNNADRRAGATGSVTAGSDPEGTRTKGTPAIPSEPEVPESAMRQPSLEKGNGFSPEDAGRAESTDIATSSSGSSSR